MEGPTLIDRSAWIVSQGQSPVVRNLLITQAYHELGEALRERLAHADSVDANWCHFGCWASKTAGSFIRKEFVPKLVADLPRPTRLFRGVNRLIDTIANQVCDEITAGNLKVFAELGPFFAELVECFPSPSTVDERRLESLLGSLAPGDTVEGGQYLLTQAARHYADSQRSATADRRQELTLWANCLVGLHEQIRLQEHIAGALDAPVETTLFDLWRAERSWIRPIVPERILRPLGRWLVRTITTAWEPIATRELMVLKIGAETLYLGNDLPPSPFPPGLKQIDDLQLQALLRRFDPNLSTTEGSKAHNWAVLQDRMGYIVELFRVRQADKALFAQPFRPSQRRSILDLDVPNGPL